MMRMGPQICKQVKKIELATPGVPPIDSTLVYTV